ncbi:hypothetical protein AAFF_G00431910 [Aldrovandia affinis]|uniref:Chemokine interleukin-8-like domain-containing protein n=1 Tax=Aldrovandia affinis TaxID=143900 RepID=A0AAD7WJA6_9TELE|nr:hypothetical protein AAFF_G00431910 [Aldrovandia affinis]
MNAAALIFLCVIVFGVGVTHCAGQMKGTERCICTGKPLKRMNLRRMQTIEVFAVSPWCSQIEIIATEKKTTQKRCLDSLGKQGRSFLYNNRQKKQIKYPKRKRGKKQRRQ